MTILLRAIQVAWAIGMPIAGAWLFRDRPADLLSFFLVYSIGMGLSFAFLGWTKK